MIEQFSLAELVAVAVFFFLLAVTLLLVVLRLAGYLGGGQEDSPMQQLVNWFNDNGIEYACIVNQAGVTTISLAAGSDADYGFEFDSEGKLILYGIGDPLFTE